MQAEPSHTGRTQAAPAGLRRDGAAVLFAAMKLLKFFFVLVLLGVAVFLALNWQLFEDNINPLLYRRGPEMTARIEDFAEHMSEAEVQSLVPKVPLSCVTDASALPLGDRVCHSNISSYAGMSALRIAFFWKDGRLANIKIDIPWWLHGRMARRLVKDFGAPDGVQDEPAVGIRLVGWRLPHGNLFYNRDRDRNPLWWNTLNWIGPTESARRGGVFMTGK